eukprot:5935178-Pyramimonas_sp.AAC.1
MPPELPLLDHERRTDTSDRAGEQTICRLSIEIITHSIAIAKRSRALRTQTTIAGQRYYNEGDLVDHHRPAIAKFD